jgi:pimeloyl-ACP methyl ester carboxylesterase
MSLIRLIDELELGCPHIIGPDIGTSAALFAAGATPRSVARVVVGSGGPAVPLALGAPLRDWALDHDFERYGSIDSATIVTVPPDAVRGYVFPRTIRDDCPESYAGERFFESMRYVRHYPDELPELAKRLPATRTPALISAGVRDRGVPTGKAEFPATTPAPAGSRRSAPRTSSGKNAPDPFSETISGWVTEGHRDVARGHV